MKDDIFNNLKEIQKEMFKLLGEVSYLTANPFLFKDDYREKWQPKCDIFITDKNLIFIFELAGVEKSSINISSNESFVKITGSRATASGGKDITYYNLEIESGFFERKVVYPVEIENYETPFVSFEGGLLILEYELKQKKEKIIELT